MVQGQDQEHLLSKIHGLNCLIFYRFMVCVQPIGASPCPGSALSLRAGRTCLTFSGRLKLKDAPSEKLWLTWD